MNGEVRRALPNPDNNDVSYHYAACCFADFTSVPPPTSPRIGCLYFQGNDRIVIARATPGTSIKLGGDFALSLGGSRSQYLPSDSSARDVKLALEAMDTVGTVDVERNDGDAEVS